MIYNPDTGEYERIDPLEPDATGGDPAPKAGDSRLGPNGWETFDGTNWVPTTPPETTPAPTTTPTTPPTPGVDANSYPNDPNQKPADTATHTWVWVNNRWQQEWKGQTPGGNTPAPTTGDAGGGGVLGQFDSAGYEWPQYQAPAFQSAGPFTPRQDTFTPTQGTFKPSRPTFDYDPFTAPTADQARSNPGYQASALQARRELESSRAYQGTLRSGMTLGDILKQQTALGDQNYNQVYGRELEGYRTNRGNAFENWAANLNAEQSAFDTNFGAEQSTFNTNYGVDRDIYDRGADEASAGNAYRFGASQAEFAPKQRKAELTFADLYSRWRDLLNSTTQIATAGD